MIILIDAEIAIDKTRSAFMVKFLEKQDYRKYLNLIKIIYDKPIGNFILNGSKTLRNLIEISNETALSTILILFHCYAGSSSWSSKARGGKLRVQVRKEESTYSHLQMIYYT